MEKLNLKTVLTRAVRIEADQKFYFLFGFFTPVAAVMAEKAWLTGNCGTVAHTKTHVRAPRQTPGIDMRKAASTPGETAPAC